MKIGNKSLAMAAKALFNPPVSRDERGARDRHDVRRDAVDAIARKTSAPLRTVKSFGSDAPVLASSSKAANAA
jgi:hypothetical protein